MNIKTLVMILASLLMSFNMLLAQEEEHQDIVLCVYRTNGPPPIDFVFDCRIALDTVNSNWYNWTESDGWQQIVTTNELDGEINELADVNAAAPQNGDVLVYSGGNWVAQPNTGGGGVYGSQYEFAQSSAITTATSNQRVSALSHTTSSLPAGVYRLSVSYHMNTDGVSSDGIVDFTINGVNPSPNSVGAQLERSESKDHAAGPEGNVNGTASGQHYPRSRHFIYTHTGGVMALAVDVRSEINNVEASVWDVLIEVLRVQ